MYSVTVITTSNPLVVHLPYAHDPVVYYVTMVTLQVELELSLPIDGDNYSNSKGESIVRRIECGVNDSTYKRCVGIM